MASWSEIAEQAPDLASLARKYLDAHLHKTIATLRRDGSPRISGIEIIFAGDDLWFGSMPRSVKALDLLRDPRFALHSGSGEPWEGDAKLSGTAEEVVDPALREPVLGSAHGDAHLFRADITELSVVRLGEPRDHLVIESWHPSRGVTTLRR